MNRQEEAINELIQEKKGKGELDTKKISDTYHTFDELYETRAVLTKALFRVYNEAMKRQWFLSPLSSASETARYYPVVWRSMLHSDGTMFDGMFIVGLFNQPGEMITFHYHLDKWDWFDFAHTRDKAPEFDGHTSEVALERIKRL